jgi:hypothetical protein
MKKIIGCVMLLFILSLIFAGLVYMVGGLRAVLIVTIAIILTLGLDYAFSLLNDGK